MADSNPYRYAGYRYEQETELYYLMARYYAPFTARFIFRDSYSGDLDKPILQNAYQYAATIQLSIDPDGNAIVLIPVLEIAGEAAVATAVVGLTGKKQGREVNEKKKTSNWTSRSNKDPNRSMKKHTPGRGHKKGKK